MPENAPSTRIRDTSAATEARRRNARERRFTAYLAEMRLTGYAVRTDASGSPVGFFRKP